MSGGGIRAALAALCTLGTLGAGVCAAATPASPAARAGGRAPAAAPAPPAAAGEVPASGAGTLTEQAADEQGIKVRMTLEVPRGGGGGRPREGEDVRFRFRLTDAATGQPLTGLSPAAWMDLLPEGEPAAGPACLRRVKELLAGSVFTQPRLDLNAYFVLALNDDASISVLDPHSGYGGSKLLAMVALAAPGEDWALAADQGTLYVSEPRAERVAVVSTATWKVAEQVAVGGRPGRVVLQPDGGALWVALEGSPTVAVIDARTRQVTARLAAGRGAHDLAFSDDGALAFITNRDDGTVTVAGVQPPAPLATLATGERPVAVAYSPLARAAYVTHEGDGAVVAIDGRRRAVVARMAARPGLGQIRFAPGGRLGFVVNSLANTVQIVDAATNRIVQTGEVGPQPDQIAFTDHLAYIRHRGTDTVLMVPLEEVGHEGAAVPVADFSAGQHALGEGGNPSLAAGIVPAPGGSAVLVVNPLDRAISYYQEGMAAPMGSFANYGRQPRAALVVDRSLGEKTRPGTYETAARLPGPAGRYRLALFLDTPRIVHCFALDLLPNPDLEAERRQAAPTAVEPLDGGPPAVAGQPAHLRFRLTDTATGTPRTGVGDLVVLIYPLSGAWQRRPLATELAGGIYEVTFTPPAAGTYAAVVESASQHLSFHLSPRLLLQVVAPGAAAPAGAAPRP